MWSIFDGLANAIARLEVAFANEAAIRWYLRSLGWEPPGDVASLGLDPSVPAAVTAAAELAREPGLSDEDRALRYVAVGAAIGAAVGHVYTVRDRLGGLPPTYVSASGIHELPDRVFENLVADHLRTWNEPAYYTVLALGLFEELSLAADTATFRTAHSRVRARTDRIELLLDPPRLLEEVYGWGTDDAALRSLVQLAELGLQAAGVDARALPPVQQKEATLALPVVVPSDGETSSLELDAVLIRAEQGGASLEAGVAVLPLPGIAGSLRPGVAITPWLRGSLELSLPLEPTGQWFLELAASGDIEDGVAVVLRPDTAPVVTTDVYGEGGGAPEIEVTGALVYRAPTTPGSPPLVRIADTIEVRVEELRLGGGVALVVGEEPNPNVLLSIAGAEVLIQPGSLDDFSSSSMPGGGARAAFDLAMRWSRAGGFAIEGSAHLLIRIPVQIELGPLRIPAIDIEAGLVDGALVIGAGVELDLTLGPVFATVSSPGVRLRLTPGSEGNIGVADIAVEGRPPSGVGLAVDAGPVSGGGFLGFYPEIGRYTGVAQLDVVGIAVRAVGIIDTVLPGGEQGFSFLLLITAEFTPIQLGMGFTLNGVGGLVGIHRTLITEPLRSGVRDGSLDNILFPEDPVRDATALIANLQSIFPPAKDQYVFGIMVKLGYGTPTLVTAEIGLILKVPDPIIVLLGSISAKLPTADAAVIDINLDILGILDFGQKLFSLDASLRDSRIAIFAISGDMAMRLSWGDPPSFALSIGGLHPAFQPPPGFPTLRRVSISVGNGANPRLGFEAYIALTSNSLQFGARLALYAEAGGFSIEGYLGFDALIIFEPFSFRFDFAAGLVIKANGAALLSITVEGMLEGPTPWHVRGRASFAILFFEISVDFDARFGEERRDALPAVSSADLLEQVRVALQDAGNWSEALPEGDPTFVSFIEAPVPDGVVRIDPLGTLTVRQKVIPFNRAVSKLGESRIDGGPVTISVSATQLGATRDESPTVVKEYFAPAQVEDLDEAAKLSRPSFERMDGGASFGADDVTAGPGRTKELAYETIRTDAPPSTSGWSLYLPSLHVVLGQVRRGARPKSVVARSGVGKFAPPKAATPLVTWRGDGEYVVATVDTLARRNDILPAPTTQGAAASRLAKYLAAHPAERGTVQVVPLQEAA